MEASEKPKKSKYKGPDGKVWSKTENVVVSASINRDLPLEKLAIGLDRAEYNPEQFPGLIFKISNPEASSLLFSSGKIICTGTKSIDEAKRAIKRIVEELGKIGIQVEVNPQIEVQNMVASGSVGGNLNLNEIVFEFENTEYEPEQFPGLVYKLIDSPVLSNITFLLFGTGKIVITGAKSEKEIKDAVKLLRDQLIESALLDEKQSVME